MKLPGFSGKWCPPASKRPRLQFCLDVFAALTRARVSPRRAWRIARLLRLIRSRQHPA